MHLAGISDHNASASVVHVHWLGSCISFTSTSSKEERKKNTKIPDCNIANFDVIKLPCFRGMFLHPPQWWRDFCTGCNSLTWVASVGYTTNEQSESRSLSEMLYERVQRNTFQSRRLGVATLIFWVKFWSWKRKERTIHDSWLCFRVALLLHC